jgi:aminoglycoside phosphotransferase (APT) family kinase protein
LAGQLTLPIPLPIRVGRPACGYPWRWSIVPWLPGVTADTDPPHASQAAAFAAFLRSLHTPAPPDAPVSQVRGVPLRQRAATVEERLDRLAATTDTITLSLRQLWEAAVSAPVDVPPTWIHGDLHPRNVLVEEGRISAIIDWGDLTSGDAATDLAAIWMLFPDEDARQAALAGYGPPSPATIQRAQGWAIFFGLVLLDTGVADNPGNARFGEKILRTVGPI